MRTLVLIVSLSVSMPAAESVVLPSASELASRIMQYDRGRQSGMQGYTSMRRYTLENKSRRASILVRASVGADGVKRFEVVEESGSSAIRKHVFGRMLDEEVAASRPDSRTASGITPENYRFTLAGEAMWNGRTTYLVDLTPKIESKYLISGRLWVDAVDFAIVRIEGQPAKNPSFWTRSVHFVHTYSKSGDYWLPASNRSVSDVRIFGKTDLTIEYFDYSPATHVLSAAGGRP